MPQSEAQAWWADVQHVRESIERRRAGLDDSSASPDASREARFARGPGGDEARGGEHARDVALGPSPAGPTSSATTRSGASTSSRSDAPGSAIFAPTAADAAARLDGLETGALEAGPPRRTVYVTGRPAASPLPRLVEVRRRRPGRRPAERVGPRPDRIALWAVLLGFFLILVAATSSHAAVHPAAASRGVASLHAATDAAKR